MPSYLERYENGEHAGVWDELRDVGADVCTDADLRRDAEAVADATMRRAATNIATLTQRLSAMGYRFGGPHKVNLARGIYEGVHPPRDRDGILERGGEDEWRLAYAPPEEHLVEPNLARAERAIGPLPLALAALFRRVGQVFLCGSFDGWNPSAFLFEDGHDTRRGDLNSDALNFIGVGSVANYISDDGVIAPFYIRGDGQFHAQIALDHVHSRGYSGGCHVVRLPAPVADPVLEHVYNRPGTTLVEYLRTAFRWGGFPGLEFETSSFSEVAQLNRGLLPI